MLYCFNFALYLLNKKLLLQIRKTKKEKMTTAWFPGLILDYPSIA